MLNHPVEMDHTAQIEALHSLSSNVVKPYDEALDYGKLCLYEMYLLGALSQHSVETIIANTIQPEGWTDMKAQAHNTIRSFVSREWITAKTHKLTKRGHEVLRTGRRGW